MLTEAERAALPANELQNLRLGHSRLRHTMKADFPVRFFTDGK